MKLMSTTGYYYRQGYKIDGRETIKLDELYIYTFKLLRVSKDCTLQCTEVQTSQLTKEAQL